MGKTQVIMASLVAKFKVLFYEFLISLIKNKKRKFKEHFLYNFENETTRNGYSIYWQLLEVGIWRRRKRTRGLLSLLTGKQLCFAMEPGKELLGCRG